MTKWALPAKQCLLLVRPIGHNAKRFLLVLQRGTPTTCELNKYSLACVFVSPQAISVGLWEGTPGHLFMGDELFLGTNIPVVWPFYRKYPPDLAVLTVCLCVARLQVPPAVLPDHVVHGNAGRRLCGHPHSDCGRALRQEQKLQV